jgi:hypothetical protein
VSASPRVTNRPTSRTAALRYRHLVLSFVLAAGLTMSGCGSDTHGDGDGDAEGTGFRSSNPVNPRNPQWGTDASDWWSFPSVGAICTLIGDSETYCGHLGRHSGSITLTNTGNTTVAVLAYPVFGPRYIVGRWVAPPGASGCFSTTDATTEGFGINIERQSGTGTTQVRVAGIDAPSNCGNNGLNMVFEPYGEGSPQWVSTDNPGKGYTCYSTGIPANGPDTYCGQLNSDNLGVETGYIRLKNDSQSPVRIVSYWQPVHSSMGSYVLGPGQEACWDFRGNKALSEQHHITLQRPYGAEPVQVRVVEIQSLGATGGRCGSNGLEMDGGGG